MRKLIGSVVAVVCGLACLGFFINQDNEPSKTDIDRLIDNANAGVATGSTASKAAKDIVKKSVITSGDWEIGEKDEFNAGVITPGTYIVTANSDGINCYWSTVKDWNQTLKSIIANGNISPGENARVVVKSNYAGLTLKGDCSAVKKK